MKLCIFLLSSLVLLTLTGITLAGDEELSATWINTDYNHFTFQKRVFNPDGTFRFYRYESSPTPELKGTYSINEKWTDSEKIIWYKLKATEIKRGKSTVASHELRSSHFMFSETHTPVPHFFI